MFVLHSISHIACEITLPTRMHYEQVYCSSMGRWCFEDVLSFLAPALAVGSCNVVVVTAQGAPVTLFPASLVSLYL